MGTGKLSRLAARARALKNGNMDEVNRLDGLFDLVGELLTLLQGKEKETGNS